jgi:hypothetical protein
MWSYFVLATLPPLILVAVLAATSGSRAALWVTLIAAALTLYFAYGTAETAKEWGQNGFMTAVMDVVTLPYLITAIYGLTVWRKRRGQSWTRPSYSRAL